MMPEMKIKLAKTEVRKAGKGYSANIIGTGEDQWFSHWVKSKDAAEALIAPLIRQEGVRLAIAYQENQKGDKVYKNWDDYQIVDVAGVKVPEPVSDKRAARTTEFLSRLADAREAYTLGLGIEREDFSEQDKHNVTLIAINMGWDK